jgi:hypothetical protein
MGAIGGADHCIVLVRDLAAARACWERLGFRTTPRGLHSPEMGTANHTLMLADDYIELLGLVAETEQSARWAARLAAAGEGLVAVALRMFDAEAAAAELAARGAAPGPVLRFGRAVALPGPGAVEARFDVVQLAEEVSPGFRLFFCRHRVPAATWPAGFAEHPNGAVAIEAYTVRAADPEGAAARLARIAGLVVTRHGGLPAVETGRARFLFAAASDGAQGIAGLSVRVRDIEAAAAALAAGGIEAERTAAAITVPPASANGVALSFVRV